MPRRIRQAGASANGVAWHPNSPANTNVIQEQPGLPIAPLGDFIFQYASVADDLPAWGTSIAGRDLQLRQFWPTETTTASALYSMTSRYSSFEWQLQGPPRIVSMYQRMLNSVQFGEGWIAMLMRFLIDLLTQDNGGHLEVVRAQDDPASPCVSLNHLDSNRCVRTGHKDTPIIYYDLRGAGHEMKWYQVISVSEFPSPIERMRGIQVCAISRLLRAAQIMRDISIYKREQISGRFNRAMYFVSGVQQRTIKDMLTEQQNDADASGLARYVQPLVIASLDPGATVKVDSIQFAKLPDNFDEDKAMHWYITQLALAFGGDYQDFAPLPQAATSGSTSRMMHQKSLSKGSRLFMKLMEQLMNYRGIIPSNVRFTYTETDQSEDQQATDMKLSRAKERQIRIMSGELTVAIARQIAADDGDLEVEYMMEMNTDPTATTINLPASDPVSTNPDLLEIDNPDKYTGDAESNVIPGAQTWGAGAVNGGAQMPTPNSVSPAGKPNAPAPTQPRNKVVPKLTPGPRS